MMMLNRERLNLTPEFAMGNQSNLTCYWGNRVELTEAEREVIKETGYKYREGRNQWLYFRSCKEGYFPYRMNQDEVHRMCYYLELLEEAVLKYRSEEVKVDFQGGEMYCRILLIRRQKTTTGARRNFRLFLSITGR